MLVSLRLPASIIDVWSAKTAIQSSLPQYTDKSFIKGQQNDPSTEPWKSPVLVSKHSLSSLLASTKWRLSDR